MFSQFVFVLKIKIKRAFPLLVHMRFLFSLSLPWDTFGSHDKNFGGRRHWAAALKSGHAVQRKRAGSLNRKVLSFSYREAARGRRPFFRPSGSVSWNLAGHWWEPSGAYRGCARPRQDSAFSEKWCCKNGMSASQATGESFFKQNLGMKVNS